MLLPAAGGSKRTGGADPRPSVEGYFGAVPDGWPTGTFFLK